MNRGTGAEAGGFSMQLLKSLMTVRGAKSAHRSLGITMRDTRGE